MWPQQIIGVEFGSKQRVGWKPTGSVLAWLSTSAEACENAVEVTNCVSAFVLRPSSERATLDYMSLKKRACEIPAFSPTPKSPTPI